MVNRMGVSGLRGWAPLVSWSGFWVRLMRVETPTSPLLPHHVPPEGRYCLCTPENSRLPEPSVCTGQTQLRPSVPNLSLFLISLFMFFNSFIACTIHLVSYVLLLSVLAVQRSWNDVRFLRFLSSFYSWKQQRERSRKTHSHRCRSWFISGDLMQPNSWKMQRDVSAGTAVL